MNSEGRRDIFVRQIREMLHDPSDIEDSNQQVENLDNDTYNGHDEELINYVKDFKCRVISC